MRNIIVFLFLVFAGSCFGQKTSLDNFKKTTIKLGKVPYIMYKGTIPVKFDRSDSSSELIFLPVHIIKSPSLSPAEPIYGMTGGPGNANLTDVPPKEFLTNHDIVLVGYRGVDEPVLKKSKKLSKAMKGLGNQLLSDRSLDNLGSAIDQYLTKFAKDGIDINHFTVLDVIDDFEDVRRQLGHQEIDLYSGSYGTRVALLYSYRYPDAIKRSFMFGINPPGHLIWYPEATERIIKTYDSIYVAQSGTEKISIEESIKESFRQMPERWTLFKLDADKIKATSFCLMFSKNSAVMAFDAYRRAALKGDYSGLYLMQLVYDYMETFGLTKTNYGDSFIKAYSADYDPYIDYRKVFRPDSLEIGAPLSMLYWGCYKWTGKMINDEYRKPRLCNTETLLVGGNLDNSNPVELTLKELLPYMPNGHKVILTNMAHCGDMAWLQHEAFVNMSLRFFDDGVVDTSKFKPDPVNFVPKRSFNKMAKWCYPFVFILSVFK